MPVPSQRQPRHPHSLSQFTGPRRFELTAQETFDFYRRRLKLIRQHLHGIALPGKARLQVIKVRCQGGRHKLRGDWFLPSAKSDIHRPTQVLGKLQGCAQRVNLLSKVTPFCHPIITPMRDGRTVGEEPQPDQPTRRTIPIRSMQISFLAAFPSLPDEKEFLQPEGANLDGISPLCGSLLHGFPQFGR